MANQEHLVLLKQGVDVWNQWRKEHPTVFPDLSEANLSEANLQGVNFSSTRLVKAHLCRANLSRANFSFAKLDKANLSEAELVEANFQGAGLFNTEFSRAYMWKATLSNTEAHFAIFFESYLVDANFRGSFLFEAIFNGAYLMRADFSGANLTNADLQLANLSWANLSGAKLEECYVHGCSAWNVQLKDTIQSNLIITNAGELQLPLDVLNAMIQSKWIPNHQIPLIITVDNLEMAQFIYLLLNNQKIREVIDTITSKVVLILGRFTLERKAILDAIREELRKHNYSPVVFDFEKPLHQTMTETIRTLAHLARFIIVDLTDPRSVPAELATIVPHCLVPVQPLLEAPTVVIEEKVTDKHVIEEGTVGGEAYALFRGVQLYPWVLPVVHYQDTVELLALLKERVIDPAEQMVQELARQK